MTRRTLYLVTLGIFVAYTVWMIGPYVRSTIVRDSSVTTWARFAVAPIKGRIVGGLPDVGSVVDDEGIVTTIRNTHLIAEERGLEEIRDRKVIAEARLQDSQTYLADLDRHRTELARVRVEIATAFKTQLEIRIASLREQITQNDASIEIVERMVDRESGLANRGAVSKASLDETLLRLSELRATRAEQKIDLDFALVRLEQAGDDVFLTEDGDTPSWVTLGLFELDTETNLARRQADESLILLDEAVRDLAVAEDLVDTLRASPVHVPPGSTIYSLFSAPDASVVEGARILEWIDCGDLLVDVPVSDVEVGLLNHGDPAEVILEGESETRAATVHLTRGSSAVLGLQDLAAVAKGRSEGVGQVLLELDAEPNDAETCPVGRAAYVRFPDVGLFDMLMARLRL